jgi:hypothetical protein
VRSPTGDGGGELDLPETVRISDDHLVEVDGVGAEVFVEDLRDLGGAAAVGERHIVLGDRDG